MWSSNQRLRNLPWVINNTRFLIMPWVKVPCLASHILGRINRQISDDWYKRWGYHPLLMETFVDPDKYNGTCYKASKWHNIGRTTGCGLVRTGKTYTTSPKLIFTRPLVKNFRKQLCREYLIGRTEIWKYHTQPGNWSKHSGIKKKTYEKLRMMEQVEELIPKTRNHVINSTSKFEIVEEEKQARRNATVEQVKVLRTQLPALLSQLSKIPDPGNPKKIKHKPTVLIYVWGFNLCLPDDFQAWGKQGDDPATVYGKLTVSFPWTGEHTA